MQEGDELRFLCTFMSESDLRLQMSRQRSTFKQAVPKEIFFVTRLL